MHLSFFEHITNIHNEYDIMNQSYNACHSVSESATLNDMYSSFSNGRLLKVFTLPSFKSMSDATCLSDTVWFHIILEFLHYIQEFANKKQPPPNANRSRCLICYVARLQSTLSPQSTSSPATQHDGCLELDEIQNIVHSHLQFHCSQTIKQKDTSMSSNICPSRHKLGDPPFSRQHSTDLNFLLKYSGSLFTAQIKITSKPSLHYDQYHTQLLIC